MNPLKMLKMKSAWDKFQRNHPKFLGFFNAARAMGIQEDTVLELKMISPSGQELVTNLKVRQEEIELFHELQELIKSEAGKD